MKKNNKTREMKSSDIEDFLALPDSEKEKIYEDLDSATLKELDARSRPLNPEERRQWRGFRAKLGRPAIGKGSKTISLTVEKDLLKKADVYAKRHGLTRSKQIAKGLLAVIGSAA
jgi:hypothetical protein